ncbi:MAG: MmgE/PrpD family protein [Candidatus Bathyarchaeia archaeon]
MSSGTATKSLIDYVLRTRYEDFPTDVIDRAKLSLLDSIGCMLGGYRTELGRIFVKTFTEIRGIRESTIIGKGDKIPMANAAFANSAMANALDYDDTYAGHPGATIIPSALAVSEKSGSDGRDLLTAIIAAYEVTIRITRAIQPSLERSKHVWFVGTPQTFGSVSAASKLLGLDLHKITNGFGIAGISSLVPSCQHWGWNDRPLHWAKDCVEWPAYLGIMAALLAKRGFLGTRSILDGETGFWIMAGSDKCDWNVLTEGLGEKYELMSLSYKPYPACRFNHSPLDGITAIMKTHNLRPDEIEKVHVKALSWLKQFMDYTPQNMVDAEFSLPYSIAMGVLGIRPGPEWYARMRLRDPKVLQIAKKVSFEADVDADKGFNMAWKLPADVQVTTKDGRVFRHSVDYPKGDPKRPMTEPELVEKFMHLASGTLGRKGADDVRELVQGIENVKNTRSLTLLLARAKSRKKTWSFAQRL